MTLHMRKRSLRNRFRSPSLSWKEIPEGKQQARISEKQFLNFFNSWLQQQPQAPPVAALLHLRWKSSQHKRNEKVKSLLSFFETFRNFFSLQMLLSQKLLSHLHQWKSRFPKRNEKVFYMFKFYFETYFFTEISIVDVGAAKKRARKDPQPDVMRTPPPKVCFFTHYW